MSSFTLGFIAQLHSGTRMYDVRFFDDQSIARQLVNVATRVGGRNFGDFVGIKPDFTLSAFQNGSSEAFL
jgi:hypothetical protein